MRARDGGMNIPVVVGSAESPVKSRKCVVVGGCRQSGTVYVFCCRTISNERCVTRRRYVLWLVLGRIILPI